MKSAWQVKESDCLFSFFIVEWEKNSGLRVPSLALVAQITAVDRTHFRSQLGVLHPDEYERVRIALVSLATL
jgi:hypothetical protein